jgi:hypothetical protein
MSEQGVKAKRWVIGAAGTVSAIVALAATAAAAETPSLELFKSACVAHSADAAAIEQELQLQDWRRLTEEELGAHATTEMTRGFTMHWARFQGWAPGDSRGPLIVLLGDGPLNGGAARGDFCLVADAIAFSRQTREVRDWLGFSRAQTWGPGGDIFAYVRAPSGELRNAAGLSESEGAEPFAQGRIGFVQVVGDQRITALNFSVIHPHHQEQGAPR